jgi:hypothetical protein
VPPLEDDVQHDSRLNINLVLVRSAGLPACPAAVAARYGSGVFSRCVLEKVLKGGGSGVRDLEGVGPARKQPETLHVTAAGAVSSWG